MTNTKTSKDRLTTLEKVVQDNCKKHDLTSGNVDSLTAKIDKLMPLTALIPILQGLAEKEESQKAVGKWLVAVGKTIGFVAVVISSIGVIFWAAVSMISEIIKTKQ